VGDGLDAALGRLDADALARDVAALVQVPSVTGDERAALERLAELAEALGLRAELSEHDLEALRAHPDHPGEEGPRTELLGLSVAVPGARDDGPRLALNGHVDVVPPGTAAWRHGPWSGTIEEGFVWGRGAVDMKGAVVAALHALGALSGRAPHGEVVLLAVSSEEDGGLGTFAALERDSAFDACLIPEPTGFDVVCAQAGSIVFEGVVEGVSAHAPHRLGGVSAVDRYVPVHAALAEHERAVNADVAHPLMRELELPYPLVVGKVQAGEWPSTVPDRLVFAGRAPVRVGEALDEARDAVEAVVAAAGDGAASVQWRGGQFAPGETPADDPFAVLVRDAVTAERGAPARVTGVPWGADMRLFCARGIPCVMVGPPGIELAHAVDERVRVDDLLSVARTIVRVAWGFSSRPA
jgi:acetylornithine deacetylase